MKQFLEKSLSYSLSYHKGLNIHLKKEHNSKLLGSAPLALYSLKTNEKHLTNVSSPSSEAKSHKSEASMGRNNIGRKTGSVELKTTHQYFVSSGQPRKRETIFTAEVIEPQEPLAEPFTPIEIANKLAKASNIAPGEIT